MGQPSLTGSQHPPSDSIRRSFASLSSSFCSDIKLTISAIIPLSPHSMPLETGGNLARAFGTSSERGRRVWAKQAAPRERTLPPKEAMPP